MDKYVISFLAPQKTVALGRIEPFYGPNNTFFHLAISISICYTRFNLRQSGLKPKSYSQPRTTSVRLSLQTVFVKPICAIYSAFCGMLWSGQAGSETGRPPRQNAPA